MTFVLVHGGGFDGRCWESLVPLLDGDVLAVDLPGRNGDPSVTVDDFADAVVAAIVERDWTDVTLVGHSLAGVPMVGAYKISPLEYLVVGRAIGKRLTSVILANLVLGENVVPQFLQHDCTSERLADALLPLLADSPERRRQVEAFSRLDAIMEIGSRVPAARAADIVLDVATGRKASSG